MIDDSHQLLVSNQGQLPCTLASSPSLVVLLPLSKVSFEMSLYQKYEHSKRRFHTSTSFSCRFPLVWDLPFMSFRQSRTGRFKRQNMHVGATVKHGVSAGVRPSVEWLLEPMEGHLGGRDATSSILHGFVRHREGRRGTEQPTTIAMAAPRNKHTSLESSLLGEPPQVRVCDVTLLHPVQGIEETLWGRTCMERASVPWTSNGNDQKADPFEKSG